MTCSALTMAGLDEIWQTVEEHRRKLTDSGELLAKRKRQALDWMRFLLEEGLKDWFFNTPEIKQALPPLQRAVEQGETTPTAAVKMMLDIFTRRQERNE